MMAQSSLNYIIYLSPRWKGSGMSSEAEESPWRQLASVPKSSEANKTKTNEKNH